MLIEKSKDLSECTDEEIQEIAEDFLMKMENTIDEYKPWFGTNAYFRMLENDFKALRELYNNSKEKYL
jgi:hypothetical protein